MSRVAAIDCGTNSIRLLVADINGSELTDVVRRMEIVRLGEGVDRTGRFADAALARTFAALDDYTKVIAANEVQRVRMVATSATRDVANRDEFLHGVEQRIGVLPDVISGDEEARLSFLGATAELVANDAVPAPYLVCDIGGGSTEFVLGDDTGVHAARSVNVGCVRMTERHLRDDPPSPPQIDAAMADIDAAIDAAAQVVDFGAARTLVGLAGSVTTVAAIAMQLAAYDADRIHHAVLPAAQVHEVAARLLAMMHAERAAMPVMHPGRVDVIGAGALVLDRIVARGGFDSVLVSEHDILDGIARSVVSAWS